MRPRGDDDRAVHPLIIFHHVRKTAGRSLQKIVRANYRRDRLAQLYGVPSDQEWCRLWWLGFPERERNELDCVVGHGTNALFSVIDRPFHAFCMVRHPLERVASLWSFFRTRHERRQSMLNVGRRADTELPAVLVRTDWTLEDIYRELGAGGLDDSPTHRAMRDFFNGQARTLARGYPDLGVPPTFAPQSSGNEDVLSPLLDRLAHDYTIGVQDRFERSVELFAAAFGWRQVFLPRRNVTDRRLRTETLPSGVRDRILEHNQLDLALYEHYAREIDPRPAARLIRRRSGRSGRGSPPPPPRPSRSGSG